VSLYNPIDHDHQLKHSYLWHISHELPLSVANPLYQLVLDEGRNNEGVYYYFLSLLHEMGLEPFTNDLKHHLQLLKECQSVSTLLMAVIIIKNNHFEF
jgi:hypothetical protein